MEEKNFISYEYKTVIVKAAEQYNGYVRGVRLGNQFNVVEYCRQSHFIDEKRQKTKAQTGACKIGEASRRPYSYH